MSMLACGKGGSDASQTLGDTTKSLRFRSTGPAYLSKTLGASGNRKKWTWSGWVSLNVLNKVHYLMIGGTSGTDNTSLIITAGNAVEFFEVIGGVSATVISNQIFRDQGAFFHVHYAYDSTLATAADRIKIYIAGVRLTSFSAVSDVALNADSLINSNIAHKIGAYYNNTNPADMSLSRVCFVDGQALDPSAFGYLNTDTNIWTTRPLNQCKSAVEGGGPNSFMLEFDNGTSLTTLGYDKSSKGNDFTLSGFSLTANYTYDWFNHCPDNNYSFISYLMNSALPYGYGGLYFSISGSVGGAYSSVRPLSGKFYYEVTIDTVTNAELMIYTSNPVIFVVGYRADGTKDVGSTSSNSAYGASWTAGDKMGVAFDTAGKTVTFYKNGVSQGAISLAAYGCNEPLFVFAQRGGGSIAGWVNYGQQPFAYTPPTGYGGVCQSTITAGFSESPKNHVDIILDAGASIQSDVQGKYPGNSIMLVKDRANADNWQLFNDLIGTVLHTNASDAEAAFATPAGSSVGLVLKAGISSQTYGPIGSGANNESASYSLVSTVSANTQAGISIVSWTANGSSPINIAHGLGVAPALVIVKSRSAVRVWRIGNKKLTSWAYSLGFSTAAQASTPTVFNSTAPTSSVFTLGSDSAVNTNGDAMIAYCFAELDGFSRIGTYAGNGSVDGPVAYCAFRPRFLLIKRLDSTSNWVLLDTSRSPGNENSNGLYLDTTAAEAAAANLDVLATGFKLRTTGAFNISGGTYLFVAFAEVVDKFTNAI